jgi:plastocyanin
MVPFTESGGARGVRSIATWGRSVAAIGAAVCAAACGSSFYSSTPVPSPTPSLLDPNQLRAAVPAVSITAGGFNPQVLHVNYPVTVTFTNNDTVAHALESAPELNWDNCPEMNTVGTLKPGQSEAVAFSEKDAVCTYHDVAQQSKTIFQGYIAIHASGS